MTSRLLFDLTVGFQPKVSNMTGAIKTVQKSKKSKFNVYVLLLSYFIKRVER